MIGAVQINQPKIEFANKLIIKRFFEQSKEKELINNKWVSKNIFYCKNCVIPEDGVRRKHKKNASGGFTNMLNHIKSCTPNWYEILVAGTTLFYIILILGCLIFISHL